MPFARALTPADPPHNMIRLYPAPALDIAQHGGCKRRPVRVNTFRNSLLCLPSSP